MSGPAPRFLFARGGKEPPLTWFPLIQTTTPSHHNTGYSLSNFRARNETHALRWCSFFHAGAGHLISGSALKASPVMGCVFTL